MRIFGLLCEGLIWPLYVLHKSHCCRGIWDPTYLIFMLISWDIHKLKITIVWVTHEHVTKIPHQPVWAVASFTCTSWRCYIRTGVDKSVLILPEWSGAASEGTWWRCETSLLTLSSYSTASVTEITHHYLFSADSELNSACYVCSVKTCRREVIDREVTKTLFSSFGCCSMWKLLFSLDHVILNLYCWLLKGNSTNCTH